MFLDEKIEKGAIVELYNGHIVDVKKGCLFPEDTIIQICDGTIAYIGDKAQRRQPAHYSMDMQGKYVMPGMINTHAHIHIVMPGVLVNMKDMRRAQQFAQQQIEKGMADCLEYGITVVRDALTDRLKEFKELRRQIETGELIGPHIYNSVHIAPLGGTYAPKYNLVQRGIMKLFGHTPPDYASDNVGIVTVPGEATNDQIRQAVETAVQRGADYVKFCEQKEKMLTYKPGALNFNEASLHAAVEACQQHHLITNIHHITLESFRKSVKCGISALAHIPLDGTLTEHDLEMFYNANTMIEPTLTVAYNYCWPFEGNGFSNHENMPKLAQMQQQTYQSVIEKYWIDELQDVALAHYENARQQKFKLMGFMDMSKVYRLMSGYISYGLKNMELLLEHGLHDRIAFGNDAGASQCSPANKDNEIDLYRLCAQNCTMDTQEINQHLIRMLTINGARLMGIDQQCGSVEENKQASLALYTDNPLHNIDVLKNKVDALMLDGKLMLNHCGLRMVVGSVV